MTLCFIHSNNFIIHACIYMYIAYCIVSFYIVSQAYTFTHITFSNAIINSVIYIHTHVYIIVKQDNSVKHNAQYHKCRAK